MRNSTSWENKVLKRRLLSLTAAAVTVVSASVLTALPATSASATTAAAASRDATAAGDCVYITDYQASLIEGEQVGIAGGGVNAPVTLESPGNCFTLHYKNTFDGYTTYEYQNGDGHCLWNNGGTLDVGAACKADHPNEEFFGYHYYSGLGWLWGNETAGDDLAYVNSPQCVIIAYVQISDNASCGLWNFPG